jgi:hypothetical protein
VSRGRLQTQLRDRQRDGDAVWPRARLEVTRERVFPSPRAEARARRGRERRRQHRPVFVDDTGRRRRAARVVGATTGLLALAYVVFVALVFAGAPGIGELAVAGLGPLTNPAGDEADVGSRPVELAVPEKVTGQADPATGPTSGDGQNDQNGQVGAPNEAVASTAVTPGSGSTTTVPPATTTLPATATTTVHGNGRPDEAPGSNSTVPDKGGPPTSSPGGP